jgi:cell division protein FtsQ
MWRRRNRRRPERPAVKWPAVQWQAIAAIAAVSAVVAGGYAASAWLLNRPIETIVINGTFQRVSPIQLEAMVEPYARAGFLEVDLGATKRDLTALPWVASAEVRRKWPGTLEVHVREETPIACWGQRGLLNAAGELFLPNADHVPAELPRLQGPAGTEAQVTARYFRVQEQLEHRGMAAVTMSLDARGAWLFQLSNGIQVRLGANSVDRRIERFFGILDGTLAHMTGEVDYVDMRYPNGFAIGWKNQEAVQAAAAEEPRPDA